MKTKSLLLTIAATIGMTVLAIAQNVPSYVPSNGLVGWWPFNGNANDESGNGNHGTVNGATLTLDRFGNQNNAFSFTGNANCQNITISNSAQLNPNNITINCWINALDSNMTILEKSDPANASKLSYAITFKDEFQGWKGLKASYGIGNCSYSAQNPAFWSPQNTYPNYTWIMVTVIINSNGDIEQYLNSNLVYSATGSQSYSPCNDPLSTLRIGGVHWNNDPECFKGSIDDLGIWNRTLTQQEIADLYNAINCTNNTAISPQTNSLPIGSTATFNTTTSDPNPSYVWQSDLGQGFQTLNNVANYSGVNSATLNIANVQLSEHNQPIRVITTSGNCIDTSNVAVISILDTCISNVTVYDTLLTTVTDTLIINTLITGINPPNNSNTIKVYPNPASTHITIDYGNFANMNGYQLKIQNSLGQQLFQTNITQQSDYLSLSTWGGNGLYFVHIIDPQGNTFDIRKIVLQ